MLRRRYFWGRGRAGGCYPSDERAGIAASTVSAGARELCCVMGLASDFRSAAANLKRVGGLAVCPERLRQVVEREAAAVAAARDAGAVPAAWSASSDALERGRLYVGADGLMVRAVTQAEKDVRRKSHVARRARRTRAGVGNLRPRLPDARPGADRAFKEVKFGVFYDQPKDRRHPVATAGDAAELGRVLRRHAAQVGVDHARQKVALTDGAPWVARQLAANLPMLTAHVLDFYHLAQHVHAAANLCLGEGTPAAADWAHARLGEAKRGGPAPVLAAVDALAKTLRAPPKREALRRLRNYVDERRATSPTTRRTGGAGGTSAPGRPRPAARTWPPGCAASG